MKVVYKASSGPTVTGLGLQSIVVKCTAAIFFWYSQSNLT